MLLREEAQDASHIGEQQLAAAFRQTPLALVAVGINSLVLSAVEWRALDHTIIFIWLFLQVLVIVGRYSLYYLFLTSRERRSTEEWERWFMIGIVGSALVWGVSSLLFFLTDNIVYQAFLTFVLAGMSAGGVVSLSSVFPAIAIYLILLLAPLSVILLLQQSAMHSAMALLITLFGLMLFVTARRFNQYIYDTFYARLQSENTSKMLELSEEYFETIFKEAPVGIVYYNTDLIIVDSNTEILKILKISRDKMIGMDLKKLPDTCLYDALNTVLSGEKGYYEGPYTTMINGLKLWLTMNTSPMYNAKRELIGGVAIIADVTEQVIAEEKIKHQAFYDPLTDIPNRILLKDRIEQSLAHYRRHHDLLAVMFLDLDHFKSINDSLGHHIGDDLLIQTAKRLSAVCREVDTVARLGGDEFVVLLNELGPDANTAATKAEAVAEKIHHSLSIPFDVDHTEPISTSSSIGIAIVSSAMQSADDLLKFADTAMYQAKKEGRNTTRFYQDQMDQWIKKRLFLENALRHAIKNRELELYYQPVIEVKSKKIIGAEALLRWNHPELGIIMPDEMIEIAEESGLIISIGTWVMREACRQFIQWKVHHPKGDEMKRIAINVSAVQFRQNNFVDHVMEIITETGINPSEVELELTESMIIDKMDSVIEKMNRLREYGVNLSMDDFGTGYSSLAYLKRLPFTTLKIDKSFIRDVMNDKDDAALVQTILSMATIFNLDVIAEGVEIFDQFEFLEHLHCRYFQGYLCSKPVKVAAFEELLNHDIQSCKARS